MKLLELNISSPKHFIQFMKGIKMHGSQEMKQQAF